MKNKYPCQVNFRQTELWTRRYYDKCQLNAGSEIQFLIRLGIIYLSYELFFSRSEINLHDCGHNTFKNLSNVIKKSKNLLKSSVKSCF